jgi:hypothetical protein
MSWHGGTHEGCPSRLHAALLNAVLFVAFSLPGISVVVGVTFLIPGVTAWAVRRRIARPPADARPDASDLAIRPA